jgi:hypothetical protein
LELILADIDDVSECPTAVRHARGRVDVDAGLEELLVHAGKCPELVVTLHEQRMMRPLERNLRGARLGDELVRILGEESELGEARTRRNCGEREEIDAARGELREDTVRRAQLVADGDVVVVDRADRVGDRAPPRVEPP